MAITEQVTCDICGKQKQQVNHWWIAVETATGFHVSPFDASRELQVFKTSLRPAMRDQGRERVHAERLSKKKGKVSMASTEQLEMRAPEVLPANEQEPQRSAALSAVNPTPDMMIMRALDKGLGIEYLTQLYALKKQVDADQARKSFVEAMSAFKAHSIQVVKDKTNTQYSSKYVSIGNLIGTVTPFLSQHGLSARWDIDQSQGIKVTCVITHKEGHSESVAMVVPPDKSGSKNPIQEIKSAITYAKACTFESICGLASTDANVDDDGNAAGGKGTATPSMDATEFKERMDFFPKCSTMGELQDHWRNSYGEAKKVTDRKAMDAFSAAKDARKAALLKDAGHQ